LWYDHDEKFVLYATENTGMAWFRKIGAMVTKFSLPLSTAGIAAVVSLYFYPQTLGLERYQRLMAHYQDGAMKPVDSEIQQLVEKVHFCL